MLISTMTTPAIQDLIRKSFTKEMFQEPGDIRRLFIKETGTDWKTDRKRIKELDRDRYAEQKVEGQSGAQRGISEGYEKDIIRKTVSVDRVGSGEEFKALEAHTLSQYATDVKKDIVDKIELDMRNFISYSTGAVSYVDNGGFLIDLTVGDSKAVFDNAHTLKNSAITYSNILTGNPVLTNTALELAEDYFEYNVLDNNGQNVEMSPDTLITSRKAIMRNRVSRLFGSISPEAIAGAANANSGVKNTYRDKYQHLAIKLDVNALGIVDATYSFYWYLASLKGQPSERFQAYYCSWLSPMVAPAEVDQSKWILSFTGRTAYGIAACSGKGILVSKAVS